MDSDSFLASRLDRGAAPLAVGDVLVILGLLTFGALQHNSVTYLTENPAYLLGIYAPFLIGWVLVAPLVGAYAPGAAESAKSSVPLVVRSWVPAAIVGLFLRWVGVFHGGAALAFAVVITVTGAVGLGVWRYVYFKVR